MNDILSLVTKLKRPRLLVQTARHGLDAYSRETQLPRILHCAAPPRTGQAILLLLELEREMNDRRVVERGDYSISEHVALLVAIMAEARLLRAPA